MLRIASSLVLAPVAIAVAYVGGYIFIAFWAIAAILVLWEWDTLVCAHDRNAVLGTGAVTLAGAGLALAFDGAGIAIVFICLGVLGFAALASRVRRLWCSAGFGYAAALLFAPVLLRGDASFGFAAILFLFVIVWLTDITAYFVGRAVGGPKLMPRVSPNKTWSGAIGGTIAGVVGGVIVARQAGGRGARRRSRGRIRALRRLAGGRPRGIRNQAPIQRQGCEPAHPRPWRLDGQARRLRRRRGSWRSDRALPRRIRCPGPGPHGMVSDAGR